jgi:hypothetical protein
MALGEEAKILWLFAVIFSSPWARNWSWMFFWKGLWIWSYLYLDAKPVSAACLGVLSEPKILIHQMQISQGFSVRTQGS